MRFLRALVTAGALLALSAACMAQVGQAATGMDVESHVGKLNGLAKNARGTYRRYCVGCHGPKGDGEGENAQWIDPKPRDFTLAKFKCRSTPSGTLPTDEDIFNSIARGLDASNMPAWNTLTSQQRVDLVAYIKHFSARWQEEKPGTPITIPPEPPVTPDRIENGQVLYQKLQCWKCHGVDGKSKGPDSDTLADDEQRPIRPFNFAVENRFKCGVSDVDLYRIFITGLDGTPMPAYVDNVNPDEAWDLVFYLRALQPARSREREIAKQIGLKPIPPDFSILGGATPGK